MIKTLPNSEIFIVKIHQNEVLSYMHLGVMKVRSL